MDDLLEQIEAFLAHHKAYNKITERYAAIQKRMIYDFVAHAQLTTINDLDSSHLRAYLSTLSLERGLKPRTVRQYQVALMPFFKWLWRHKQIDGQLLMELQDVELPRGAVARTTPRPYTRDQIQRLWDDVDRYYPWANKGTDPDQLVNAQKWLRRWMEGKSAFVRVAPFARRLQIEAIICHSLMGMLRRIENYSLDVEAMHPDNEYVLVKGVRKNPHGEPRPREVPWTTKQYRETVARWLEFRAILKPPHNRPWLTLRSPYDYLNPMSVGTFEDLLLDMGWEFHRLRHTGATELLRAGMPIDRLQIILGHANIQETLGYAKIVRKDIVLAARRTEDALSEALDRQPPNTGEQSG